MCIIYIKYSIKCRSIDHYYIICRFCSGHPHSRPFSLFVWFNSHEIQAIKIEIQMNFEGSKCVCLLWILLKIFDLPNVLCIYTSFLLHQPNNKKKLCFFFKSNFVFFSLYYCWCLSVRCKRTYILSTCFLNVDKRSRKRSLAKL